MNNTIHSGLDPPTSINLLQAIRKGQPTPCRKLVIETSLPDDPCCIKLTVQANYPNYSLLW